MDKKVNHILRQSANILSCLYQSIEKTVWSGRSNGIQYMRGHSDTI